MAKQDITLKAAIAIETKKAMVALTNFQHRITNIGKTLGSAFSIASVSLFARAVINTGKEFEDQMARVKAVSNATVGEFNTLTQAARKMGETTRYTATEAASALENLVRAGMKATEASKALPAVLQLAQANAIELSDAAKILRVSLNEFGLSTSDATRVADVLSTVAANTATNILELFDALTNVAPAAKVLGFTIEETTAALGALAQRGVTGAAAGTQLRIGLIKMVDPKIIKKAHELGVNVDELSMKTQGLYKTMQEFNGLSLEQLTEIFSQKGAVGVQQLVNGLEDMQYIMGVIQNQSEDTMGTTERMFRDGVGSMRKELDTLKSKWESTLINMSQGGTGRAVTGIIRFLQNLADMLRNGVGSAMLALSTFIIPALVKGLESIHKWIKNIGAQTKALQKMGWTNLWTAILQAAALATTAIVGYFQRINKPIKDAKNELSEFRGEIEKNRTASLKLGEDLQKLAQGGGSFNQMIKIIDKLKALFPDLADAMASAAKNALANGDWEKFRNILEDINNLQKSITITNARQNVYDAQVSKVASNLIHPMFSEGLGEYGYVGKSIANYFSGKYSPSAIEQIFRDIVEIIIKTGDTAKSRKAIIDLLTSYDEDFKKYKDNYPFINWIEAIKQTKTFSDALGNYNKIVNQSRENLEKQVSLQRTLFYDQLSNVENDPTIKGTEHLRRSQYSIVSKYANYLDSVVSDAFSAGYKEWANELKKESKDLRDKYGALLIEATEKGWDALEDIDKNNPVAKPLRKYEEEAEKLKNQYERGVITQKEYRQKLLEIGAETYETIAGVSELDAELALLGGRFKALAKEVQDAWRELKAITATGKADKVITDARENIQKANEKARQQYANFFADYPTYQYRDRSNDVNLSHLEIAQLDLKEKQENLEKISEWLKGLDTNKFADIFARAIPEIEKAYVLSKELSKNINDDNILVEYLKTVQELDEAIKDLQKDLTFENAMKGFKKIGNGLTGIYGSLKNINEAYKEYYKTNQGFLDEETLKKWDYYMSIIEGLSNLFQSLKNISEGVNIVLDLIAKDRVKNSMMIVGANAAETASEQAKATVQMKAAVAGGAGSVAKIPYLGPALAVAAAAAIAMAIKNNSKGFATGGIIGYGSPSGDNTMARVNKGEMILNKAQQANLFKSLNQGSVGNGEVQFRIQGKDLIGCLRNNKLLTTGKLN